MNFYSCFFWFYGYINCGRNIVIIVGNFIDVWFCYIYGRIFFDSNIFLFYFLISFIECIVLIILSFLIIFNINY